MLPFLRRADLLAGGFLLSFASSLGQTWFIALSGPSLRLDLGLSHGAFGTLYALGTLLSGLTLMWLGAKIDWIAPRRASLAVAVGLGASCLAMSLVVHPLVLLGVLFGLRLCGQGLMSHLALTTTARGFPAARGRALAFVGLGFPAAEALLPIIVVLGIAAFGWRLTWAIAGVAAILLLPPLFAVLLSRAPGAMEQVAGGATSLGPTLRRRDILLTARFNLLLPTMLATGFVATAIFFHQGALSAAKGWTDDWFAACIPAYAAASVTATLVAGFFVDRYGARRVLPLFLLPLAAAMALLAATAAPLAGLAAMALMGLTAGANNTVVTASLAEIYGGANLGMVRALGASAMIFASALSPALAGLALDAGASMEVVLVACLGLSLGAGPLAARGIVVGASALGPKEAT